MRDKREDLIKLAIILRHKARTTLTELSEKTGIPVSTVYEKLQKHGHKYISKHVSLLNFHSLGYRTTSWFLVKVKKDKKMEIEKKLKENKSINILTRTSGNYDYVIEGIFENMNGVEKFIEKTERITGVKNITPLFSLENIYREEFKLPEHHNQS